MAPRTYSAGVVLFEGFTVLDAYGPIQAFWAAFEPNPGGPPTRLYTISTVALQAGPVKSGEGPVTVADYGLDNAPAFDILLIPGGGGTRPGVNNEELLAGIIAAAAKAEYVTTVCTGAALLARGGGLDGRRATSNKMAWEWVTSQGPAVEWVRRARWVEDGNVVTSSGVSAGIDMALGVIARLHGVEAAERSAKLMEYIWNRDPDNDPFV